MKNIKLTTTGNKKIIVNWDNVVFIKNTHSHYGDEYVEIHFGDAKIDVKETLQEIEERLLNE